MTKHKFHSKFLTIPLKLPINVRGKTLYSIETFSIFKDDVEIFSSNHLPEFHQIEIFQKEQALLHFLNNFDVENLSLTDFNLIHDRLTHLHPEIQFTIESFLFNYCLLNSLSEKIDIKYNFLYTGPEVEYFDCIKIKVTPATPIDEVIKVLQNSHILEVRLDGNQSFNKVTLQSFLEKIPEELKNKITYFEEPLKNIFESIEVLNKFNLSYALDESFEISQSINYSGIKYVVLKPSLIGFFTTIELIKKFHQQGIKIIISSAYETQYSFYSLIYLADQSNRISNTQIFHGLDTFKFFHAPFLRINTHKNKVSLL